MKKGITAVTVAILVIIIVILTGTVTVTSYNSMQNAKKITFALELSNIQEELDSYMRDSFDAEYPITGSQYTFTVSTSSAKVADQFYDETKNSNNEVTLYEIDLSVIGIDDTEYGNKKSEKDIYVVSKETGRVFYLQGIKFKDVTYYTLTQDLIDIKERNEKEEISENNDAPVITTAGFNVRTIDGNEENIYLSDIKVEGKDVTKIKFDRTQVAEDDAYEYFKNNGETLSSDRIKVNEGEYITIYAENSSGNWSIKQEGIPTIPEGFYYVGGSIPTGVVISDSKLDANKGTAINGKVTSDGLSGNQFVWIPYTSNNNLTRRDSDISKEPYYTDTYTTEIDEFNAMEASVKKYKGFYLGRYEAGDGDVTTNRTGYTDAHTVVSKKGAIVYNRVWWGTSMTSYGTNSATGLSKAMYKDSKSVVSTLTYNSQYLIVANYIKDKVDISNTITWGNSSDFDKSLVAEAGTLCTTGFSDYWMAKNIYDLAGNIAELTMASYNENMRLYLGRSCWTSSGYVTTLAADLPVDSGALRVGFRVSLYLK